MKELDREAVKHFLFDLNTQVWTGMECIRDNHGLEQLKHCFELRLRANKSCTGMISPTEQTMLLIRRLGKRYFKAEADFNNTGTTFWFIK